MSPDFLDFKPILYTGPIRKESISVVLPCYNDTNIIGKLVLSAIDTLKKLTHNYEVIVVNDGSTDESQEVLEELQKKYQNLKIIRHTQNRSHAAALKTGFTHVTKDLVFFTDGDGQYDVRELVSLLEVMDESVAMVNGYKNRRAEPLYRVITGRIYHWLVKFVFNLRLKDVDCDFKVIRRHVLEKIKLRSCRAICVEMMKKAQDAGFNIKQVLVHHYHRAYGKSEFFNFKSIFQNAVGLVILWWELVA